jgi:hypothetical protein
LSEEGSSVSSDTQLRVWGVPRRPDAGLQDSNLVNRRRLLFSPLWFFVALATLITGTMSLAHASSGLETRVRAFDHISADSVGQTGSETPGGVGCLRPEQPAIVVGACVATNTVDDLGHDAVLVRGGTNAPDRFSGGVV